MQAQMYVVAYINWPINECKLVEEVINEDGWRDDKTYPITDEYGNYLCGRTVEVIIAPDGTISKTIVALGNVRGRAKAEDLGGLRGLELLKQISKTSNSIISKGYSLLPSENRNFEHLITTKRDDHSQVAGELDYILFLFTK